MVYNVFSEYFIFERVELRYMKSSDMIRELCKNKNISIAELSRRIGQTPQNFNKKLKRDTITLDEMVSIADTLDVSYKQVFILEDGRKIQIGNTEVQKHGQ